MSRRPLVLTLLAIWSLVGGGLTAAQVTVTTDYASTGQVALAIAALGVVIALVHVVVAAGLWRTAAWGRTLGLLAFALAALVELAVATAVGDWLVAGAHLAGNALSFVLLVRHTSGFHDGERRPDEVSAHVGR